MIFYSEVGIFLIDVWIIYCEVVIIPIVVDRFLTAIGLFLNGVVDFLFEVFLILYVLKSYSFYLTEFWTCCAIN